MSQVRLRQWQRTFEVGYGFPLPAVQTTFDLQDHHIAAPAVLDRLVDVPLAFNRVLDLIEKRNIVIPGYLCKRHLHKLLVGIGFGEGTHVFEIAWRESLHVRKGCTKVSGQTINYFCTPALLPLALKDI